MRKETGTRRKILSTDDKEETSFQRPTYEDHLRVTQVGRLGQWLAAYVRQIDIVIHVVAELK